MRPAINRVPEESSDMMAGMEEAIRARRLFVQMVRHILSDKEEDERRRQREG